VNTDWKSEKSLHVSEYLPGSDGPYEILRSDPVAVPSPSRCRDAEQLNCAVSASMLVSVSCGCLRLTSQFVFGYCPLHELGNTISPPPLRLNKLPIISRALSPWGQDTGGRLPARLLLNTVMYTISSSSMLEERTYICQCISPTTKLLSRWKCTSPLRNAPSSSQADKPHCPIINNKQILTTRQVMTWTNNVNID
jgi:hypothetical protein